MCGRNRPILNGRSMVHRSRKEGRRDVYEAWPDSGPRASITCGSMNFARYPGYNKDGEKPTEMEEDK